MKARVELALNRLLRPVALVAMSAALLMAGSALAASAGASTSRSGLSSTDYAAVEKTLIASLPLDSGVRAAWRKAYRASCDQLRAHDALLADYRQVCLESAATYDASAAYNACTYVSPAMKNQLKRDNLINRCEARSDDLLATANVRLVAAYGPLNAILNRDVSSESCRTSFGGTHAVLSYYRAMAPLLRLMATALVKNSANKMSAAEVRAEQLETKYTIPTNRQQLTEFKQACS